VSSVYEETSYFYGKPEKHCLEIRYMLLSICPEDKRVQSYFAACTTPLCLQACLSSSSRAATIESLERQPGYSLCLSRLPPETHDKASPGQEMVPVPLRAETEHSRSQ